MSANLIERVLKTIRNYDMLKSGDGVVAAVSGGPDSVFMLYALDSLKRKLGIKRISVCNLDHGLRGDESKEDSRFVRILSKKLGLDFFHKRLKLREKKPVKLSTEEFARACRYEFFKEIAAKTGANTIATGHTLDDHAETIIMRFIKGSSLKGMAGISPVRGDGKLRVIRPVIELEKEEIARYLDGNIIAYKVDRTNLEPIYFRNVVRSEIVPFLEKYNPRLKRVLFNLAEHVREDFKFIEDEKRRCQKEMSLGRRYPPEVRIKDIAVQPKAIQKEILRDLLEKAGGEVKKLSFRHWKEMEALIKRKRRGSAVHLPGGIEVTRTERSLTFTPI
ncbi:MAG: tRNA lysidine(34) synthetase TilS [Candidatus Omnitrophota bacterium]|nr:tRNA lysidine(34) synthetase TilS [Candidatus Omnitrophota bacterium]